MRMVGKLCLRIIILCWVLIVFSGCEAIFTTSLFKDLMAPEIAEIPQAQLPEYCWSVMAEGTPEEQAALLASVQLIIENGSTDPDLNYVAGVMTLELAGLSMDAMIPDPDNPPEVTLTPEEYFELLQDVGGYFATAVEGGVELTEMDLLLGGVGLLFSTLDSIEDLATVDFESPTADQETAIEMINQALLALFGAEPGTADADLIIGLLGV